ncbi:hypothetical protein LX99_02253 [Mucilaginibacter oryzae]|uniref:Uncharacterized protein n=1 Tax=Mucilaginibacter oryzae TaxID=468058 RepID=A0A316HB32_9SPHI|nr:hypothetical protein [Mucilaginibacter oryzae]PWK78409.1 hypothetical protein LX99_02253 [Mucilaginibacter oryzae]
MNYKQAINTMDLSFEAYNQRQLGEISAEKNRERAWNARPAGNFIYKNPDWQPLEYEGFAVVSMLNENPGNEPLTARLIAIQQELSLNLSPRSAFYQLPPQSFHQTVANTLSADRFKQHILHVGLEETYPAMVANAFNRIPSTGGESIIRMKMVGLSIFGTAIGILGVFEDEADYSRIVNFRSAFYADEQLAQLDVKMTRPFIGHITLTYIEQSLNKNQKEHLATVISEINEGLALEENYFHIALTGLRRYHHLADFMKKDDYPVHQF